MGDILLSVENPRKARHYVEALGEFGVAGERIQVLMPEGPRLDFAALAARADGLVLAGGPDVEPRRYGEEPLAEAALALDPPLDALELELLVGAHEARTPVWAICRGMQLLNVFLGGTLYQDLRLQFPGVGEHNVGHPLDRLVHGLDRISTASELGSELAAEPAEVNSRHHQAVRVLAPGLRAVAYSPDGVLEVAETETDDWWVQAVQWHPENLTAIPLQRRLWNRFVDRAGEPHKGRQALTAAASPAR